MQEEKIKKEDKIIKYGKKIIALMIVLFIFLLFKNSNSAEMASFNMFLFNAGIYFIFIEILIFLSNYIQKIKSQSIYINIFLFLMSLCILNYILTKNINIFYIILIIILFWALKEIFSIRKLRIVVFVLFIIVPLVALNFHIELYYKMAGRIIERKVEVPAFYGIETAQSECENEMPKKCKFIKWKKVGFETMPCWDCGYFIVDCYYGCPKSYSE